MNWFMFMKLLELWTIAIKLFVVAERVSFERGCEAIVVCWVVVMVAVVIVVSYR